MRIPNGILEFNNEMDYLLMREQIEAMQKITFGSSINALLITDRLNGCAQGLKEYLSNSSDIVVQLVNNYADAASIISAQPIDFLIVVGYLQEKDNYDAVSAVKQFNKYSNVIMYANLDEHIITHCEKYKINDFWHRPRSSGKHNYPISAFVTYMSELYDEQTRYMHEEVSPETTREQLWAETLDAQRSFSSVG